MSTEYRISSGWKVVQIILALFFAVLSVILMAGVGVRKAGPIVLLVGLCFLAVAILIIYRSFSRVITADEDSLRYYNGFTQKELAFNDLKGYRIEGGRYKWLRLISNTDSQLNIRIGDYSNFGNIDELMRSIQNRCGDLDLADKAQETQTLLHEDRLGESEAERARALQTAKVIAIIYNVGGFALLLLLTVSSRWIFLGPLIHPLIGLIVMATSKGLIRLYANPRRSAIQTLVIGFTVPCFLLLFTGFGNYDILHYASLWLPSLLVGIVLFVLLYVFGFNKTAEAIAAQLIVMVVFALIYGVGVITHLNGALDDTPGQVYETSVAARHVTHGRSTSYYVQLSPWGPVHGYQEESVHRSFYNSVNIGDTVEVVLHPGWMHIPWYRIRKPVTIITPLLR